MSGATAVNAVRVTVTPQSLTINGQQFDRKVPLRQYVSALGSPTATVDAGPPAPVPYRNNQVYVFSPLGVYLTEHHASRLIESVNVIFDRAESPFPIEGEFGGILEIDGHVIRPEMREDELGVLSLVRDLPGEFSMTLDSFWIGVSAKGRRLSRAKRGRARRVGRVSICFVA